MTTGSDSTLMPHALIHVPHAATLVPAEVREQFVLTDEQLADEIRLITDHLTDSLFAVPDSRALAVRFPVSRLVVDPERFESDDEERMAARGMGVVDQQTARQTPLRRPLSAAEREGLLERWYRPHHRALTDAVAAILHAHDRCLIVDAHSFPSTALPYELDQEAHRPDICIGTDDFHTPPVLTELAVRLCREAGWTVAVNRPFAGALVPMAYFRKEPRVHAVMVEVNRRLYLDERTGARGEAFDRCRATLRGVLHKLIDANGTADGISPALWTAYNSTVFSALIDGREIRIRIGGIDPWLERCLDARGLSTWAYITAWNPGSRELAAPKNDARHEQLKIEVARLGFAAFEGQGEPVDRGWVPERSLLVLGIPADDAVAIGRRYGQLAIVAGEAGGVATLLRCAG